VLYGPVFWRVFDSVLLSVLKVNFTMVDKIEMSLDDIIKSSKQARGPAGRRGRGGQRGSSLSRRGTRGGLRGSLGAARNSRRGNISRSAPYSRVSFEILVLRILL
jgi:hypothetical protein